MPRSLQWAGRSTPTPTWCKTSASLSPGQFVRDEPRTINGDDNGDDKGGVNKLARRPHRCEDGITRGRSRLFASRVATCELVSLRDSDDIHYEILSADKSTGVICGFVRATKGVNKDLSNRNFNLRIYALTVSFYDQTAREKLITQSDIFFATKSTKEIIWEIR